MVTRRDASGIAFGVANGFLVSALSTPKAAAELDVALDHQTCSALAGISRESPLCLRGQLGVLRDMRV